MYFVVAIEVIQIARGWDYFARSFHPILTAATTILGGPCLDVLFIWLVARRRRAWPRWIMLLPVVIGIPYSLKWLFLISAFDFGVVCLADTAQTVAMILIFTGNAREWFADKAERQIRTPAIST